ncbi:hypothetical protein [Streptomyces sp. NPDC127098]|uniref:hypothetical protein n=1 Tax=Streptomyces sp. NPDC127098 TaxID=3347137 RepID=UPI00365443D9
MPLRPQISFDHQPGVGVTVHGADAAPWISEGRHHPVRLLEQQGFFYAHDLKALRLHRDTPFITQLRRAAESMSLLSDLDYDVTADPRLLVAYTRLTAPSDIYAERLRQATTPTEAGAIIDGVLNHRDGPLAQLQDFLTAFGDYLERMNTPPSRALEQRLSTAQSLITSASRLLAGTGEVVTHLPAAHRPPHPQPPAHPGRTT